MTAILYPHDAAWTESKATVNFDGAPVSVRSAASLWEAVAHSAYALPDNPTSSVGVSLYCRADDEGGRWYAVHGPDGSRGVSSSATEARAMALRFALDGTGLFGISDNPGPANAVEDPNDEYRDPMEEPGAWACGDCGLYPLAAGEHHDCP